MLSDGKRIYMAGAGGMLGEAFHEVFAPRHTVRCTDKDVNAGWLSPLDFRDFAAYRADVFSFGPDYLFHLGAYTDLEYCELNRDDTYATNTLAVENASHSGLPVSFAISVANSASALRTTLAKRPRRPRSGRTGCARPTGRESGARRGDFGGQSPTSPDHSSSPVAGLVEVRVPALAAAPGDFSLTCCILLHRLAHSPGSL